MKYDLGLDDTYGAAVAGDVRIGGLEAADRAERVGAARSRAEAVVRVEAPAAVGARDVEGLPAAVACAALEDDLLSAVRDREAAQASAKAHRGPRPGPARSRREAQ